MRLCDDDNDVVIVVNDDINDDIRNDIDDMVKEDLHIDDINVDLGGIDLKNNYDDDVNKDSVDIFNEDDKSYVIGYLRRCSTILSTIIHHNQDAHP